VPSVADGEESIVNPMDARAAATQILICEHIDNSKMVKSEMRIRITGEATSSDVIRKPLVRMCRIKRVIEK
jgi:hypothetical protein